MNRLSTAIRDRARAWARKRQGIDAQSVQLHGRRIYILPTAQGWAFGILLFVMLVGSMNYNNSLGLAISFGLAGFGIIVMHQCHRMLVGLQIDCQSAEAVFAGKLARFPITLTNQSRYARKDIAVFHRGQFAGCVNLAASEKKTLHIGVATQQRGSIELDRFSIQCQYPAGLLRSWAWINCPLEGIVYPAPAHKNDTPAPRATVAGSGKDDPKGDADFAGLREYHAGDSPRHIAWKSYARNEQLRVKQFAGSDYAPHLFDWAATGGDTEQRLAQLCRWIVDADKERREFGLSLPSREFPPAYNPRHVHECLAALARF